jgi:hypothetical protein
MVLCDVIPAIFLLDFFNGLIGCEMKLLVSFVKFGWWIVGVSYYLCSRQHFCPRAVQPPDSYTKHPFMPAVIYACSMTSQTNELCFERREWDVQTEKVNGWIE